VSRNSKQIVVAGRPLACVLLATGHVYRGRCTLVSHGQNAEGVKMFQQAYYQARAATAFSNRSSRIRQTPDGYYNLAATYHKLGNLHGAEG